MQGHESADSGRGTDAGAGSLPQIKTVLEQQFSVNSLSNPGAVGTTARSSPAILQVSQGFAYTWDNAAPLGSKVSGMTLNGDPIVPATTYRLTMNNFIGAGGDDFPALTLGTNETTGADDLVALEAYLEAHVPYTPVTTARITRLN